MSLAEELALLCKRVKEQDKEIHRLSEKRKRISRGSKNERMKFIAIKTDDGGMIKGKLAFYCRMLKVSLQGFYKYLAIKNRLWKYQVLADAIIEIILNEPLKKCLTDITEIKDKDGKLYVSAIFE